MFKVENCWHLNTQRKSLLNSGCINEKMKTTLIIQKEKQTAKIFSQSNWSWIFYDCFFSYPSCPQPSTKILYSKYLLPISYNLTLTLVKKISWTLRIRFWYERFQILDNLLDTDPIWGAPQDLGTGERPRPLDQSESSIRVTWSSLDQWGVW